jgi:glycosyltransferase involved in cell wall biosynthesis
MNASLVITTLNEAPSVESLCAGVLCQTSPPSELIVVDGGSTDGTPERFLEKRDTFNAKGIALTVIVEAGASIAMGRNVAIRNARNSIIAVTDAGCLLEPDWLENLVQPLLTGDADFVGGFFKPVVRNAFQTRLAAFTIGQHPGSGFLPSSRSVAFRREVWEKAGGYPEWLPWGEDTYFNERLIAAGARYVTVGNAIVHWELRPNLRSALKQQYRYAYGDGLRQRRTRGQLILLTGFSLAVVFAPFTFGLSLVLIPFMSIAWIIKKNLRMSDLRLVALGVGLQTARVVGYIRGYADSFGRRIR